MVVSAPLLSATGIVATRRADGHDIRVLNGVDIALRAGDIVELRGPSGAGKTTLLLALARLLPGAGGILALEGEPATAIAPEVWRTRVALLPQRTVLSEGAVAYNLRLPFSLKVREGVAAPEECDLREALDDVGLDDISLRRDARQLSVGQVARVALLRVLLARPRVLLLDEPDASLDDASAAAVAGMTARFAAEGGAVLRVSHLRTDAAATANYRLAAGRLTEVIADAS
ncbi:MAG: ATP-binding cassette domain-containing protein [Actinomycetota bacterium]|nr:MAG: putative ABC transport system ATP-binding [Actinomycetota bacterium]MDO8950522.1 ATP-binding cassette domain-containing protein [Actinomycetota bacterium]MDP3630926.1 ATP-binding cassette domain-containing protein [Actinomycetota bacterium]